MPKPTELDRRTRARLVAAYRDGPLTSAATRAAFRIGWPRLRRVLAEEGVPLRRSGAARAPVPASHPPTAAASRPAPKAAGDLGGRLTRLLAERIERLERDADAEADPERTARALALNVRTLATLRRVAADQDDDATADQDAAPPRTLAELRDQLRGHLQRLRDEERARRRAGGARPKPG